MRMSARVILLLAAFAMAAPAQTLVQAAHAYGGWTPMNVALGKQVSQGDQLLLACGLPVMGATLQISDTLAASFQPVGQALAPQGAAGGGGTWVQSMLFTAAAPSSGSETVTVTAAPSSQINISCHLIEMAAWTGWTLDTAAAQAGSSGYAQPGAGVASTDWTLELVSGNNNRGFTLPQQPSAFQIADANSYTGDLLLLGKGTPPALSSDWSWTTAQWSFKQGALWNRICGPAADGSGTTCIDIQPNTTNTFKVYLAPGMTQIGTMTITVTPGSQ